MGTTTTEEPTTTVQTTTTVIATTTTMLDDPRPPSFQIDIKLQLTVPWNDDLSNTASATYINYAAELTAWITEILTPVLEENNLDLYVGIIFIEPKTKNRRRRAADSLVTKFKLVFWQRSQLSQVFRSASLGALGATVSGQMDQVISDGLDSYDGDLVDKSAAPIIKYTEPKEEGPYEW